MEIDNREFFMLLIDSHIQNVMGAYDGINNHLTYENVYDMGLQAGKAVVILAQAKIHALNNNVLR